MRKVGIAFSLKLGVSAQAPAVDHLAVDRQPSEQDQQYASVCAVAVAHTHAL